ncbi:hypothetical protein BDZ85DRAFT_289801 [Elsinoe ampelina]|uniref:Uncharacterized protein n=1 Tax=Elsinoe ampelina TaxID=302913 RepID=A0A6A6GBW8_9PEZI|nr:hypothetical protein BDZ85DRAFT_289801 [Elsinoe ampelina]
MSSFYLALLTLFVLFHGRVSGWVDETGLRGTSDILWTSLVTTFLATYTILCLNVPSRGESWVWPLARRFLWMGVAMLGPEFVLAAASGQWAAATRSVEAFKIAGYPQWTMRHAFFADMGGIELNARDSPPFRINATHLHWLVTQGYLPFPDIPLEEIWDKSKFDSVAKLITLLQVSYLILQCVARGIQHLTITTLELFALAIVVCAIPISFCWRHKPVDFKLPMKLHMATSISDLLCAAGDEAARPYQQTPLDFIDDLKPSWSLNIQTYVHMPIPPFERPIPRFGNDRFPWLELPHSTALSVATLLYAGIHLFAWNWSFPSQTESILWRISSMIMVGSTVAFWVVETVAVWYRWNGGERYWFQLWGQLEEYERLQAEREKKSKLDGRPPFPLKSEFWVMFCLALVYGSARLYLFVEAFWGLRALEPSAYVAIDWLKIIPHV